MSIIRHAVKTDIASMVALSEQKRADYAQHQPLFWRKASDSAVQQTPFFEHLPGQENTIMLVAENDEHIDGFIIARIAPAPPVYDIGGLNCLIDDFCIADETAWSTVGRALLDEVSAIARERGAVQMVVVSGHHDSAKRAFLEQAGLLPASVWYTKAI